MASTAMKSLKRTCGAQVFPAKIYRLQTKVSDLGLLACEADYFIDLLNLSDEECLVGYLWKTFPGYLIQSTEKISELSSPRWMSSGMAFRGECWTQNISEHPNAVVESILSEVVEQCVPLKYFLNKKQLQSLLDRADARNVPMPEKLKQAIRAQICLLSNTPELDEFLQQGHKEKDLETTAKRILATREEVPTLFVRRMTPLEYERLQGFPEGWTQIDGAPLETPSPYRLSNGLGVE